METNTSNASVNTTAEAFAFYKANIGKGLTIQEIMVKYVEYIIKLNKYDTKPTIRYS